jgi:hypothetical protein
MHKPLTPNLDKMLKVRPQSQPQGEFLDWLLGVKGYLLCEYVEGHEFPVMANTGGTEHLLAEYHGISYDGMEQERQALVEWLRKGAPR